MLRQLIVFAATVSIVLGSNPSPHGMEGPCPEPAPVANFDASKFAGVWHDVLHTSRHTALTLHCDQLKFLTLNASRLSFSSFTYSVKSEKVISVLGTADVIGKSGNLDIRIPSLAKKGKVRVIYADYATLAVLWACNPKENNMRVESAVVITRGKAPEMSKFSLAKNILLVNKLSTDSLKVTLQLNCKKYDFDSNTEMNSNEGDNTSLAPLLFGKPVPQPAPKPGDNGGHH